ncbi:prostaglandin D2 receptor 2 [Oncorhynchus tshawytscha]|uniref:G-protein coupled receptors family 1 profile domain-containing protein n=1 Tax=Oncorhynchus tshawytscha TaxID=74940 RepID=A0AAZ3QZV5_ONCTS|nr:prostaglandin D2 receptor 2 [Oncorhynchus tshawytscha]XP_024290370.1 prostaglandin D2 receptor 2 [Oncorhynchus tshawytscha]XP_024290371.1 prostaglandin D2 receptor 2 [Oncorhynchus tshawytscha]
MTNSSRSPGYCPLIQAMVNASVPSNSSAEVGALSLATVCLHGLVSSFGILENILILGVVGFRVRRTVISVWIINLAASDLLATASLPFFTIFLARGGTWTLGTTFCKLHSSIFFLNMFVSAFLLAAISLDRCLVVHKPVWVHNRRNVQLVGRVCGIIWALAVLCTVPYYLFRDTIHRHDGRVMCYYNYAQYLPVREFDLKELCEARQDALAFSKLLLAFILPLVVIVWSYVSVTIGIARRGRNRHPFRFVRLVVAVLMSFVVCWAPYHVFSILEAVAQYRPSLRGLVASGLPPTASLAFLNSVLNPILYVFSCPDLCHKIRQSLAAVMESVLAEDLGEWSRRQSTQRSSSSTSELLLRGRRSLNNAPSLRGRDFRAEEEAAQKTKEPHPAN